jgi:glutamate/tyrosine decarboxylase-like PLP-dependent enzyme
MQKPTGLGELRRAGSSGLFRHLTAEELTSLGSEHRPGAPTVRRPATGPPPAVPVDLKALFLGPQAANAEWVEQLLLRVFRDHVFWRLNFHPEDLPAVQPEEQFNPAYQTFLAHFQRELFLLLGELKSDIPFYSPRYIGHMLADVSLPALIGYFATLLYNPNNCSWEVSPVTSLIEIEVGRELAKMLGFGRTVAELAATWGHVTSGGTVANIEALWVAKALKFLPLAVRFAAVDLEMPGFTPGWSHQPLTQMSAWELVNCSPAQALDLKDRLLQTYTAAHPQLSAEEAAAAVMDRLRAHDIQTLGDHAFFARLTGTDALNTPIVLVPQTAHYSLLKGAAVAGIGAGQVVAIAIDERYRMDLKLLDAALETALAERRPVIMVVGVAGSTEEGAVDPIHALVARRDELVRRGLGFFLHCDAAYGGYMAACLREPEGELRPLAAVQADYDGWPPADVYAGFAAIGQTDAATVDPHKLGYVPYPAGAVVFRDGRCKALIAQEAPYALGGRAAHPGEVSLGRYILEGSKPGAAAAAIFLSHRVVPLDRRGYGKLLGHTARIARVFHQRLLELAERLADEFIVAPLTLPDTNILDYCFNPVGNDRLDRMNAFAQALYRQLSIDPQNPVQIRHFIVSHTEFGYGSYHPRVVRALLEDRLGIRGDYFVPAAEVRRRRQTGETGYDDAVMVFRTALMNPFMLEKVQDGKDYIDLFLEELPDFLRQAQA